MKRCVLILVAAFCLWAAPLRAHIGSPAVVFDGLAGPYSVRVIVLPPPVVPGRAEINVRLLQEDSGPAKVTVLPVNWRAGLRGAPPSDEAVPVKGDPLLRHADLWLMTSGSYSVHVTVTGGRGTGTVIVPVLSVATQRLPMSPWLGALLSVLGVALFASSIALVGSGVSDSVMADDTARTVSQRRRGYVASALAFVVFGFGLYEGKRWWDDEDRNYRTNEIYRPLPLQASYRSSADRRTLTLDVEPDPNRGSKLMLIPDHGKLMHLFMIREPELDALAHVHPVRSGPHSFAVTPPPLPAGRYRLYADITYETGFAATLTTTVDLPPPSEAKEPASMGPHDPDDSWFVGTPLTAGHDDTILERTGPTEIRAGEDLTLSFAVKDRDGDPVELEPYMGMLGHAAVRRSDGSVFAHIHPVGTISMASQMYFMQAAARQTGKPVPMDHSMHAMPAGNTGAISFPYLFPQAGAYRIWVQTKVKDKIVTGVFDVVAAPAK